MAGCGLSNSRRKALISWEGSEARVCTLLLNSSADVTRSPNLAATKSQPSTRSVAYGGRLQRSTERNRDTAMRTSMTVSLARRTTDVSMPPISVAICSSSRCCARVSIHAMYLESSQYDPIVCATTINPRHPSPKYRRIRQRFHISLQSRAKYWVWRK